MVPDTMSKISYGTTKGPGKSLRWYLNFLGGSIYNFIRGLVGYALRKSLKSEVLALTKN